MSCLLICLLCSFISYVRSFIRPLCLLLSANGVVSNSFFCACCVSLLWLLLLLLLAVSFFISSYSIILSFFLVFLSMGAKSHARTRIRLMLAYIPFCCRCRRRFLSIRWLCEFYSNPMKWIITSMDNNIWKWIERKRWQAKQPPLTTPPTITVTQPLPPTTIQVTWIFNHGCFRFVPSSKLYQIV